MTSINADKSVGQLVGERIARASVFEAYGIDFCCGGQQSLSAACSEKGIDLDEVLSKLAVTDAEKPQDDATDYSAMALDQLADHIVSTHHAYLGRELPRLTEMAGKVTRAHGEKDSRLSTVETTLQALSDELTSHMMKEERILFPAIRELAQTEGLPQMPCGTLSGPIDVMEHEHDSAGNALEQLRNLTDNHTPPDWACNTFRALLAGIHELELDLHQHIHKENNILFPRALELEQQRQ